MKDTDLTILAQIPAPLRMQSPGDPCIPLCLHKNLITIYEPIIYKSVSCIQIRMAHTTLSLYRFHATIFYIDYVWNTMYM